MKTNTLLHGVLSLNLAISLLSVTALGAGKKSSSSSKETPAAPQVLQIAKPFRDAHLATIKTIPFALPNGTVVDLTADLKSLMEGATARSSLYRLTENPNEDACQSRLEIRAALTTLDMDVFGAGIKIGYTPTGDFAPGVTPISGTARVDIGLIGMDFSVWRCLRESCAQIIAARVTNKMVDAQASMQIDFNQIKASADFVYKTPLGNTLAKMMAAGASALTTHERFDTLPWRAQVQEVIPGATPAKTQVWLNAGDGEHLQPGDAFTVLAPSPNEGECGAYQVIGYIKATSLTSPVSLSAQPEWQDPSRPIRAGDVVMVRKK